MVESLEKYKINDVHVHMGRSNGIYHSLPFEEIIPYITKYQINNIALMPFEIDTVIDNLKIIELSKKYKFIHGLYWIQKSRLDEDLKILEKELDVSLVGVKFHGAYENLPVSSNEYESVMELLNEKRSCILIHCGRFKDGHSDSNTSFVHAIKLAQKYSGMRVIMGHMGGNDTSVVKKAVNMAKDVKNVFFETSGISTPFRVEYAVNILGPNRIMFGSDYPWCSFRGNFYNVEDSLLDEKAKHLIFSENFEKIVLKK